MLESNEPQVAIVNMGLGNLFSIKQACLEVGLQPFITSSVDELLAADAVILPGVGAFSKAMDAIKRLGLYEPLLEVAEHKPFLGICLGMQLLMTESHEFGHCKGLDVIPGQVKKIAFPDLPSKIPHVGWNRITRGKKSTDTDPWDATILDGLPDGEFMYFVHSFYVEPETDETRLSFTEYGGLEFCSSIQYKNIFACQFHPERSGPMGLRVYRNLAAIIKKEL